MRQNSERYLSTRPKAILAATASGFFPSPLPAQTLCAFFFHGLSGHLIAGHPARTHRGDLHPELFDEVLEVIRAGDKISFTIEFQQYADRAPQMNVGADQTFVGFFAFAFSGESDPQSRASAGFSTLPPFLRGLSCIP